MAGRLQCDRCKKTTQEWPKGNPQILFRHDLLCAECQAVKKVVDELVETYSHKALAATAAEIDIYRAEMQRRVESGEPL